MRTYWMQYGEPQGEHVEATVIIEYSERKQVDRIEGRLPIEALEVWDENEHVHDDGSLLLSAVDKDTRQYLHHHFEEF